MSDNTKALGGNATCLRLFIEFFKMGLFTVGGGMAMVPVLQEMVVDKYGWMDEKETVDVIAVCQSLPGVVAVNMATFVGTKLRGTRGAVASTVGIILPSLILISIIAAFLGQIDQISYVQGALKGLRAASVGLIAWANWKMAKQVLMGKGWFAWAIAILSLGSVAIFNVNAVIAILGGLVLGLCYCAVTGKNSAKAAEENCLAGNAGEAEENCLAGNAGEAENAGSEESEKGGDE